MLQPVRLTYGADPEIFISKDGKIIGSEKIIPKDGIKPHDVIRAFVVRDGIQIELHPYARESVRGLGLELERGFKVLRDHLLKFPGVELDYNVLVDVSQEERDSLSEDSRILGCQPSLNCYETRPITVDGATYPKRAAGGHLHLGLLRNVPAIYDSVTTDRRKDLVPLLDIFVGNTSVLLDRDPGNRIRRENYGRAGEYRIPDHGLEYRTLSNYWLRNYALMDLVFGMANFATAVLNRRLLTGEDLERELIETVDINKVIQAVDQNDTTLAMTNFLTIRPFIAKYAEKGFPLYADNIDRFLTFVREVNRRPGRTGLQFFFPQTPLEHWTTSTFNSFPSFLKSVY